MKMKGNQSPAEAIREEINRMRGELGTGELSNTDEVVEGSESDISVESTDTSSDETNADPFESATYEEPSPTPKEVPREQTVEYWKSRFDVMQGKYNAEVPRLNDKVNTLVEQVTLLNSRMEHQQTAPQTQTTAETDDLEEQYGADFTNSIDARIARIAKQSVQEQVGKFETDLSTIKQTQAVSEQQMFDDTVSSLAPKWRSLNVDPTFVSWVQNNVEQFSGTTFQDILIDAYVQRDASKVAKIFNTYEQLKSNKTNAAPNKGADASSMIAPPKRGSNANATAENNNGKVFTMAQVNDFYTNLTQGRYKGKDVWVRSMKEEIQKANSEGRIV